MKTMSYEKNRNQRKDKEQSVVNLSCQYCVREIGLRAWLLSYPLLSEIVTSDLCYTYTSSKKVSFAYCCNTCWYRAAECLSVWTKTKRGVNWF